MFASFLILHLSVGTYQVLVTVLDVNDYRPRFVERVFNTSVYENEPSGTSVITVKATDLDEGENGAVLYSMLGPHLGESTEGIGLSKTVSVKTLIFLKDVQKIVVLIYYIFS